MKQNHGPEGMRLFDATFANGLPGARWPGRTAAADSTCDERNEPGAGSSSNQLSDRVTNRPDCSFYTRIDAC